MERLVRLGAAAPAPLTGERLTGVVSGRVAIERYHRYLMARDLGRGVDVLDLACGEGHGSALLAQVARSVVGIDTDSQVVEVARREHPQPNLTFEVGDAGALSLADAGFDVVVWFEALERLAAQERILAELRRVLRPGGLLVLGTPVQALHIAPATSPDPFHVHGLSRGDLEDLLRRRFAHVALASQQALIGSMIASDTPAAAIRAYDRRGETVFAHDGLAGAPYIIALASDAGLPPLPHSLYSCQTDPDSDRHVGRDAERTRRAAAEEIERIRRAAAAGLDEARWLAARSADDREQALRLLEDARARVDALEASTIWRAAGPLRQFGNAFPATARLLRRGAKLAWWTLTLQLAERYRARRARAVAQPLLAEQPEGAPTPRPNAGSSGAIRIRSSDRPVVSIIVATYGQVAYTLDCLRSIADHPPRCPIEVLVVDDAYPDQQAVREVGDVAGIRLSRNPANLGFLRSCNAAARDARGRYLYLLNNDACVLDGAIDALVDLLEARPDAGMAGSKLLFPDGGLQEAGSIVWADGTAWNYGYGDPDPARPEYNYLREVDYCSGASIMVRRELFEQLGGFDEMYAPAYYEDADLAFRIRELGLKVLYEPLSAVIHHSGISHGSDLGRGVKAHQPLNQARFVKRWGERLGREHYANGQHVIRARDRSGRRKLMLVIDHYVPEPDRDAGSRSIMGVMESLVAAGWTVKFWPHNRTHSAFYGLALERRGIEVIDVRWPGGLAHWLRENGGELDHVLVSRPDVADDVLPHLVRGTGAVLSYNGVDLHFARIRRQAAVTNDSVLLARADEWEALERRVWRRFDLVLYLSEDEAQSVRAMSPGRLVRAVVPYALEIAPARTVPAPGRDILFVAGFAHPPNVDAAEFLVREILPRLVKELGPLRVTLAGSNPTEAVRALAGRNVEVTGYVPQEELARLYATHRVAVVPLRFGAGVKGKVVEALCHGLPLVTTWTGAQGIEGLSELVPVHDDVAGLVAALKRLLTHDEAWLAQSRAQTAFAQCRFSRQAMQASVVAALEAAEQAAGRVTRDSWNRDSSVVDLTFASK